MEYFVFQHHPSFHSTTIRAWLYSVNFCMVPCMLNRTIGLRIQLNCLNYQKVCYFLIISWIYIHLFIHVLMYHGFHILPKHSYSTYEIFTLVVCYMKGVLKWSFIISFLMIAFIFTTYFLLLLIRRLIFSLRRFSYPPTLHTRKK